MAIPDLVQQRAMAQHAAQQIILSCYLGIVPIVAGRKLDRADSFGDQSAIGQEIAEEAWKITMAVVKKVGVNITDP